MHIDGQFINCVSFIGKQTEVGFYAEGTCFFLQVVEEEHMLFTYAVTASHIIRNLTGDVISIRVQRRPDLPPKIFNTSKSEWHNHPDPDIDICAYTIDWRIWNTDNDLNILALTQGVILTPEKQKLLGFGVGSDVFIPSAFVAALGERQNIPVVRFGHVAAMALEPIAVASPKRPAFLIETRSLGGMSGSPVMFHTDPARSGQRETLQTDDAGFLITPYFLVGIVSGAWSGLYPTDFVMIDDQKTDVAFNSGISVVLPVADIMEVINHDELRNKRTASTEEIRKRSGYGALSK